MNDFHTTIEKNDREKMKALVTRIIYDCKRNRMR